MFAFQNLILMGIFFSIPLYLQIVQGFDAFETGLRMLPVSVTLFITALLGSRLSRRVAPRTIVRAGVVLLVAASLLLLGTIEPEIDTTPFAIAMAVFGVAMGLIVSQLGNVVQSAVGEDDRGEAGGLQYTSQQLGASLGTALIGAIVISGLAASFQADVEANPQISAAAKEEVGVRLESGVSFVSSAQVRDAAEEEGLPQAEVNAIVDHYADSQLFALKTGLLVAALLSAAAFLFTSSLPARAGPAREPDPPPREHALA
jgi:Na+/melibiose symporter-like transporter